MAIDNKKLIIGICEDTGKAVLMSLEGKQYICLHCTTREQEIKEILKYLKKYV